MLRSVVQQSLTCFVLDAFDHVYICANRTKKKVTEALEGLLQGWFSVIATLKSHFAKYIAIGAAIGDSLYKLLGPTMIRITQGALRRGIIRRPRKLL